VDAEKLLAEKDAKIAQQEAIAAQQAAKLFKVFHWPCPSFSIG